MPPGGRNCAAANLRTLSERRRLAKGGKTFFRITLLAPLSAASTMKLHYRAIARDSRIHLLARTLSIRRGTMYQNEERKWRRIEVDNRGNGEREFVEFVCLRIFDKRKKGKREIIGGIIGEEREKGICRIHFACFFHLL